MSALAPFPLVDHETFIRLNRSREFIAEYFDSPLTLRTAASEAFLSPFHYHRLFVRAFKETPHDFMTRIRIEQAKKLLLTTDMTVTEVCFEVGYSSVGNFCTLFKQVVGCSPREFRINLRFYSLWKPYYRFIPNCFTVALGG